MLHTTAHEYSASGMPTVRESFSRPRHIVCGWQTSGCCAYSSAHVIFARDSGRSRGFCTAEAARPRGQVCPDRFHRPCRSYGTRCAGRHSGNRSVRTISPPQADAAEAELNERRENVHPPPGTWTSRHSAMAAIGHAAPDVNMRPEWKPWMPLQAEVIQPN